MCVGGVVGCCECFGYYCSGGGCDDESDDWEEPDCGHVTDAVILAGHPIGWDIKVSILTKRVYSFLQLVVQVEQSICTRCFGFIESVSIHLGDAQLDSEAYSMTSMSPMWLEP